MSFAPASLVFAAGLLCLTYLVAVRSAQRPDLWRALPRERRVGELMAIACLVWTAAHVIPMLEGSRSMNLSNAVSVIIYEGWRQLGFKNSC